MDKFNTIYVNGCSFSEGGGLHYKEIPELYKKKHGIYWDDYRTLTYGYRVAEHFDCELVMDAKCGGGLERVIRKFWEFVKDKSDEELNKVLFLIEAPGAQQRLDFYS